VSIANSNVASADVLRPESSPITDDRYPPAPPPPAVPPPEPPPPAITKYSTTRGVSGALALAFLKTAKLLIPEFDKLLIDIKAYKSISEPNTLKLKFVLDA
jgi:hypothetical protein